MLLLDLNVDVYPGWEVEAAKFVYRFGRRFDDVKKALVGPSLELIHGLFIHVR
jgi:hypothetical protein